MEYHNTIEEKRGFVNFFRNIPRGDHFRIVACLSIMTEKSPSQWQRVIQRLMKEDLEVDIKHHEGVVLNTFVASEDPYVFFYQAANAMKKLVLK